MTWSGLYRVELLIFYVLHFPKSTLFSWKPEKCPARLNAKNEIVSAHPQVWQDTIPFLASNFPSLKAVSNGRVFRVSSKTIFWEPEPTKTVSEHYYEHTPTNCTHTNFPFSTHRTFWMAAFCVSKLVAYAQAISGASLKQP